MIHLILTLDYELFGNGKGNVSRHIIQPTSDLLKICKKMNVKVTIMPEMVEIEMFKKYDSILKNDLGYSPFKKIASQLNKAKNKGHDIQLHIHTQWLNAVYINHKWILSKNIMSNILDFNNVEKINIIKRQKQLLSDILNQNQNKIFALRLSNISWKQAPKSTIPALKKCNIKVHTLKASENKYTNGYFYLSKDIVELPIFSIKNKQWKSITPTRIFQAFYRLFNGSNFLGGGKISSNPFQVLNRVVFSKFDYCKQTAYEMEKFLIFALKKYSKAKVDIPIVLIGHSKDFHLNSKNLERFLNIVNNKYKGKVCFNTISGFFKGKNGFI